MSLLIAKNDSLPFEARKNTAHIFNNLLRNNICNFIDYLAEKFEIILNLINGYSHQDTALCCGSMLRECIRFDVLAQRILASDRVWLFFDVYVHVTSFEIAGDAFYSLEELLTTKSNRIISSTFLNSQYDKVMIKYNVSL
jgi:calcium binding protein 39